MTLSDRLSTELIGEDELRKLVRAYFPDTSEKAIRNVVNALRDGIKDDLAKRQIAIEADLRIELIGPHDGHYDESRKYCPYCVESDRLYASLEHYCRHDT